MVDKQAHLKTVQRSHLETIMSKYQTLSDGKSKFYPHKQVYLKLLSDAIHHHQRAYPMT